MNLIDFARIRPRHTTGRVSSWDASGRNADHWIIQPGEWWGEGDDMIWIDGYTWPPDLHGTGSEDYLGQAWETQDNAFLRNGVTIDEQVTGGYQTSYLFHLENAVRFRESLRVTIEHGHANHLGNDMASTAYWYARVPTGATPPPPVAQRLRAEMYPDWYLGNPSNLDVPQAPDDHRSGKFRMADLWRTARTIGIMTSAHRHPE